MTLRKAAEVAWEEHIKDCSCKAVGKWNKKGGTTENYHAFIEGHKAAAVLAEKEILKKGRLEKYFEEESTKMMLLVANTNCDRLLEVLPLNEKLWKLVRIIKKAIQDIEAEAYEKVEGAFGK